MNALKKRKIIRNLIFCILIIIIALIIILFCIAKIYYSNEDVSKLRYLNSDKIKDGYVMVPYNINMVYSYYPGDLSLISIEKSMYYFAKEVIPEYREKLSQMSLDEIRAYYEENKYAIGVDTGIDNLEDFTTLVNGIKKLGNNLEIATYELGGEEPSKTSKYLITRLLIKYKNNKRIIFKVRISKDILKNISSIKYLYEKIEE